METPSVAWNIRVCLGKKPVVLSIVSAATKYLLIIYDKIIPLF
jgi:hypothetical protein